jgi:D-alanine--poly(phosphoribitol) ligase subunit 1
MALIPAAFEANDIAYVLFTSGSTGNPKGVMISRQSLDNYVNFLPQLGFGFGERVSQQPNLGFDISMTDIFGALCYGGTLFPLSSDFDKLTPGHFIANKKITIWNSTPSSISLMIRGRQINNASFSTIKKIILIGEALYEEHLIPIFEANPNILVINSYGPTEATIAVTYLSLTSSNYTNYSNNSISIGSCIPGNELHLIGGKTKNEGEIVICGKQLSYGYINEAEKTKQQFKKFSMNSEVKFGYFTGDWAEIIDGNIYFRERIDFQAKIDGHRIELEEITAAIRKLGWDLVVAFVLENKLVAAIETIDGLQINKKKIREDLKIDLDNYAIPSMFIEIHKMPRNDNDKIDRKKLIDICRKKLNLT